MMKKLILMGMVGLCFLSAWAEITVTNLVVVQREGTKLVDISYDVSSTETNVVTVLLMVSNGTVAVSALSVSGDIGEGVVRGMGKGMVWDAGADWNGNVADLTLTIFVYDGIALCPVAKTGQIISDHTGDDGDHRSGVVWPEPRFTDNGDGTVLDNLTGLEWVKEPSSVSGNSEKMVWNDAIDFCKGLSYAGYDDWRLPSRKELMSLVDYGRYSLALPQGHPFVGVLYGNYWSGTSRAGLTSRAWCMNIYAGGMSNENKTDNGYTWPVRGGR